MRSFGCAFFRSFDVRSLELRNLISVDVFVDVFVKDPADSADPGKVAFTSAYLDTRHRGQDEPRTQ